MISSHLFKAFLECPTKCWLRAQNEPATGNLYAEWRRAQNERYRKEWLERRVAIVAEADRVLSPTFEANPKSETADLDRRACRTGYPEVAHAHVGALGERLIVRDEGVGLNNIGPSRASGLEAGVEVLEGLFELRPHVARADDVALCIACQLAGDVDGLTRACDRDDMRIGGLSLLYADVHARRLDPVDFHGHNSSPVADVHQRRGCRYDPGYCNRATGETWES
jgi:hypothetical protein